MALVHFGCRNALNLYREVSFFHEACNRILSAGLIYSNDLPGEARLDESILVRHAANGDTATWEALMLLYQEAVFRLAYLLLGDPDDAEDIAQESFLRAWRSLRSFDASRPLRLWLLSITANLSRNRRRSVGRYFAALMRIFRTEPVPAPQQIPVTMMPVTATPLAATSSLITLLEEMSGETTLTGAQRLAGYPILLPSYPTDLGESNRVFVQDAGDPMTILVWIDPQKPDQESISLHFIPERSWVVKKVAPVNIEETSVNGHYAVWTIGPYLLRLRNGDMDVAHMVDGHVLIWEEDGITYRLETDLPLDEEVKIAESLKPIP